MTNTLHERAKEIEESIGMSIDQAEKTEKVNSKLLSN